MKKYTGFSKTGIVFGALGVALLGIFAFFIISNILNATNYENYDFFSIIESTKDNGWIGDHVKGSKDAPVVIYEYADYQCSVCAAYNPYVNQAVTELDGKLAVVYRNFLLSYHSNSTAAASAAEAAGLQGYWQAYADRLFATQEEWFYATGNERTNLFVKYFNEVTDGKGDVEKFNHDRASSEVAKKLEFDAGIAKRSELPGTPSFLIDGQLIAFGNKGGGSVTVNGKTITWDSAQTGSKLVDLLKEITEAKLSTMDNTSSTETK